MLRLVVCESLQEQKLCRSFLLCFPPLGNGNSCILQAKLMSFRTEDVFQHIRQVLEGFLFRSFGLGG